MEMLDEEREDDREEVAREEEVEELEKVLLRDACFLDGEEKGLTAENSGWLKFHVLQKKRKKEKKEEVGKPSSTKIKKNKDTKKKIWL